MQPSLFSNFFNNSSFDIISKSYLRGPGIDFITS